jgi:hypothetical protein
VALSLFAFLFSPRSEAGGPLGRQGTPLQTSDYTLELFQGPILASSRITAMGGAASALASGAEGIAFNAASASPRDPYSTRRIDYDLTLGLTFPSSIAHTDFENSGKTFGYRDFVWATVGGVLQVGSWGVGAVVSLQNYALGAPPELRLETSDVKALTVRLFKFDLVASHAFFADQLHVGGGLRAASFNAVDPSASSSLLLGTYGVGTQAGVLWRPLRLPLRVGATVRSPVLRTLESGNGVTENVATGDRTIGRFYLPRGVQLPWELEWGTAVQFGERPLNVGWTDEQTLALPTADARRVLRSRARAMPRQKFLVSFSMLLTGPTTGAIGVASMLAQVVDRSGERASASMRAGVETEVLPNRLQLRMGSYMEPTRFRESTPRLHGTTGFEVRVFDWSAFGLFAEDNAFRISGAVDGARGYFGWSLSIGSWY